MDISDLDPKVGLLRPEKFEADLNDALARALESGEPLTLVFLDIDRFKSVNDNHGHPIGDEVLAGVAGLLQGVVGARGTCYRNGGEEFTVLLPNFTAEEGAAVAERARLQIERNPVSKAQLSVTASFGVAEAPAHATSAEDLLKRADDALYDAKHRGRNLVRISGEPAPSGPPVAKPRRRQPDPTAISDAQAETIRHQYFRSGEANCPEDGAKLGIAEVPAHNRKAADLSIYCPSCGLRAMLRGPR